MMINIPRVREALSRYRVQHGIGWYCATEGTTTLVGGCFLTALALDAGVRPAQMFACDGEGDMIRALLAPVLQRVYGIDDVMFSNTILVFDRRDDGADLRTRSARATERVLSMYERHNQKALQQSLVEVS